MSEFRNDLEGRRTRMAKRAEQAAQGRNEAAAEARHVEENTQRLRALRLAKEAADREAVEREPPKAARKPARRKPAAKAIKVEELNAEDDG